MTILCPGTPFYLHIHGILWRKQIAGHRVETPPVGSVLVLSLARGTTSLGTRAHKIDNYNPEAMVDSHPMFLSNTKDDSGHRGDHSKQQPIDSGFIQVQPATVVGKLMSLLPLRSVGPRRRAVANVALAEALHEENPDPWSPHMLKLYFFLAVAFLNSFSNGYDSSLMGGLNNMKYYHSYGPCTLQFVTVINCLQVFQAPDNRFPNGSYFLYLYDR